MNKRKITDTAASVRQRLLNLAKDRKLLFQSLSQHYALERWLYRLAQSKQEPCFILKGALLLTVWNLPASRPTRDIDLLGRSSNNLELIQESIADICLSKVPEDGLKFDVGSIKTTRIAKDALYEGVRAEFFGMLGSMRLPMQVDIGFSDVVTPAPIEIRFPTLLDFPAPYLRAYNRETAIAEKIEAMVKLGELNSRVKDFYDIWALSMYSALDGISLQTAIKATFGRRNTPIDPSALCFAENYRDNPNKAKQWAAFIKRSALNEAPANFSDLWSKVTDFVIPIIDASAKDQNFLNTGLPEAPGKI